MRPSDWNWVGRGEQWCVWGDEGRIDAPNLQLTGSVNRVVGECSTTLE